MKTFQSTILLRDSSPPVVGTETLKDYAVLPSSSHPTGGGLGTTQPRARGAVKEERWPPKGQHFRAQVRHPVLLIQDPSLLLRMRKGLAFCRPELSLSSTGLHLKWESVTLLNNCLSDLKEEVHPPSVNTSKPQALCIAQDIKSL